MTHYFRMQAYVMRLKKSKVMFKEFEREFSCDKEENMMSSVGTLREKVLFVFNEVNTCVFLMLFNYTTKIFF